jgi:hypothetical protein
MSKGLFSHYLIVIDNVIQGISTNRVEGTEITYYRLGLIINHKFI